MSWAKQKKRFIHSKKWHTCSQVQLRQYQASWSRKSLAILLERLPFLKFGDFDTNSAKTILKAKAESTIRYEHGRDETNAQTTTASSRGRRMRQPAYLIKKSCFWLYSNLYINPIYARVCLWFWWRRVTRQTFVLTASVKIETVQTNGQYYYGIVY